MIAKGNLHAHGAKLAAYLTTAKDGERAELVELRGFVADDIRDAFTDVQIQAAATRAEKPFFHAYVRLPEGEGQLATPQWQRIADRIEQGLGFEGQGRAVAFHHQANGETHMHMAWSRIDLESMKAIDPGLYKNKLKEMCRELEDELGLTKVSSARAEDSKTRSADRNEFEQSRRLGTDLKAIRNTIHDCWQSADSGRAFAAALDEQGLILARGDKRDFVVVDRAGGDHALGRRITGATAAETRARMADIDRSGLPSVEQARERQMQNEQPQQDQQNQAAAAGQEQAKAEAATKQAQLERAAAQEEARQRYERNEPYDQTRHRLSEGQQAQQEAWQAKVEAKNPDRLRPEQVAGNAAQAGKEVARGGLRVVDRATGAVSSLGDFVSNLVSTSPASPAPEKVDMRRLATEPAYRKQHQLAQHAEAQRRGLSEQALDDIRRDVEAGRDLKAEDVTKLTPQHLDQIASKGDAYVVQMIESSRKRADEFWKGRERERE